MLSVGSPFRYTIPGFELIAVELRQMWIKGYDRDGIEPTYDVFVWNEPLCRSYPTWMTVKDFTVMEVSLYLLNINIILIYGRVDMGEF